MRVLRVLKREEKSDVYCLTVEGFPGFIVQGGVLVHNCADAIRGALEFLHESKTPQDLDPLAKILKKNKAGTHVSPQHLNRFYANKRV